MTIIHYATQKKADNLGFTFKFDGSDYYVIYDKTGETVGTGRRPATALQSAIEYVATKGNGIGDIAKPKKAKPTKAKPVDEDVEDIDDEDEEEDDEEVEPRNRPFPGKYKELYKENQGKCGDEISLTLSAYVTDGKGKLDLNALVEVIAANNLIEKQSKWTACNGGLLRATVSNCLRGLVRKGTDVTIGGTTIRGVASD